MLAQEERRSKVGRASVADTKSNSKQKGKSKAKVTWKILYALPTQMCVPSYFANFAGLH